MIPKTAIIKSDNAPGYASRNTKPIDATKVDAEKNIKIFFLTFCWAPIAPRTAPIAKIT